MTKNPSPVCPCYKCEDRYVRVELDSVVRCHSTCERYKEFCKECAVIREKVYAARSEQKMMDDFQFRCVERTKKRLGSKKPFGQK